MLAIPTPHGLSLNLHPAPVGPLAKAGALGRKEGCRPTAPKVRCVTYPSSRPESAGVLSMIGASGTHSGGALTRAAGTSCPKVQAISRCSGETTSRSELRSGGREIDLVMRLWPTLTMF